MCMPRRARNVLGTKNDIYLQYVKTKISIHALRFHIDEGTIRPITRSAAGWILLSALPEENRQHRAPCQHRDRDALERVTTAEIMKRLAEIRAQGYCRGECPARGGATIAVLLPATVQGQTVTLALGGVADRVKSNFKSYLAALQTAAESVRVERDFESPVHIDL